MKFAGNSIRVRILVPILAFALVITIILLLTVYSVSHSVSVKYFEFMLSRHSMDISRILDTAVTELISARLLNNAEVVEAKQKIVLEQLAEHWDRNNLEGIIMKADGTSLYSSLDSQTRGLLRPLIARTGPFHVEKGLEHINGFTTEFPAWRWKVTTIHKPVSWFFELHRKEIILLFPIILFGMGGLIFSIFVILSRNFQRPVVNILSDLSKGGEVMGTGVAELDTIVKAINDSFHELLSETAHVKRFRQVIDSAFDLVLITNEQGHITYVNPACERITGYTSTELIGEKADILFGAQGEVLPGDIWNTLLNDNAWRGEFLNRKKDGETYYTSAVIFPMPGEGTKNYASIQRDITQEKKLHEQLLRAQKLDAIGTLAGGFAHDFNNILTAILGYAELMRDMATEGDPFFRPANIILSAAEQGAELTKKILSITRKEKTEVKPVNINEVIHTSMDLLQRSIPKTIEIVTRLSEEVPKVLADPSQIQQVIVNLAINSRDAMPGGGKLVMDTEFVPKEPVIGGEERKFVKLSISDTGIGMDAVTQKKIFDPFFTTKETGKGTGLGLYIAHSIVSGYGGHILVYSEPGMGTTFNLYFPVAEETEAGVTEEEEDLRGSGTVLVIDDEPHVRELCSDILLRLGYRVLSAGGGSEGIEIFRDMKDQISVVVLDMIMPKMGGSEVYETLKVIQPDVRAVLCSGYSQEGISGIDALLKGGVKKFIQKPFSRHALGLALKEALRD